MKTIRAGNTLFYYDGPQIFEARDTIGGHYIAVMLESQNSNDCYLVTGVSPESLRQFRSGALDLKTLLVEAGQEIWYLAKLAEDKDGILILEQQKTPIHQSGFLPDEGFLLHNRPSSDLVLREARERNNLVLEIAAEPPEAADEHRIRVDTFVALLIRVQVMVKYAYRAALKELSSGNRTAIDRTDAHLLDVVVPAATGSFRVVLEASNGPDMFGQNELARALQLVDVFFENAANPEHTLDIVKKHRGRLATAYLQLLRSLVKYKTGLKYSWAEPFDPEPMHRTVSGKEAELLTETLSKVSNLGSESVTLVGEFERFNRSAGRWSLLTKEGIFSGKIEEGGPNMDGLEAGGRYEFFCIEESEEVEGTGKESHTLYLKEHRPA